MDALQRQAYLRCTDKEGRGYEKIPSVEKLVFESYFQHVVQQGLNFEEHAVQFSEVIEKSGIRVCDIKEKLGTKDFPKVVIESELDRQLAKCIQQLNTTGLQPDTADAKGRLFLSRIKRLIFIGANVKSTDNNQQTPLHHAVLSRYVEVVKLLIDSGADVNATDRYEETALYDAVFYNDLEVVQLLIDSGADVNANATDRHKKTPLHEAVSWGHIGCAGLLIAHGARVSLNTVAVAEGIRMKGYLFWKVLTRAFVKPFSIAWNSVESFVLLCHRLSYQVLRR